MPKDCLLRSGDFHHCPKREYIVFKKDINVPGSDRRIDRNCFKSCLSEMHVPLHIKHRLCPSGPRLDVGPKMSKHFMVLNDMFDDLNKLGSILHCVKANEHTGVDSFFVAEVDVILLWLNEEVKDHSFQES